MGLFTKHHILCGNIALVACCPVVAQANEIGRMYRAGYHLGMGDTGVAFARGSDAVFYNPAGIALSEPLLSEVSIIRPQFEFARTSENLYRQVASGQDALEVVAGATGKQQYAAAQNYTGIVFNRAAMGLFQRGQIDAFVGSDPLNGLPKAELGAAAYVGAHLSFARPVGSNLFLGTNVKVVQKVQSRIEMNALEAQSLESKEAQQYLQEIIERGTGVGADFGAIYRTNSKTRASFGAVVRNIGMAYHWAVEEDAPLPSAEPTVVDVGIALEPETRKSRSRLTFDFRDVLDEMGENPYKRMHMGAELSFQDVLGGTIGLNQGYLTYGGYVNIRFVRVEAGVFSEEFGDFPGARQSKRAYGRIGVGWFE